MEKSVRERVDPQTGNPTFFDNVYHGIWVEARLTGTEAPVQQQLENRATLEDLLTGVHSSAVRAEKMSSPVGGNDHVDP